jgi:SHS2 domain-containing protein
MTISRSYSRKVNLGNYTSEDYFCSRNIELPADISIAEAQEFSEQLFALAMTDVERDMRKVASMRDEEGHISSERLKQLLEDTLKGKSMMLDEYELLTVGQKMAINEKKKEYKRSDEYKATLKPNTRAKE